MGRVFHGRVCVLRAVDSLGFKRGFALIRDLFDGGGAGAVERVAAGELRLFRGVDPFKTSSGVPHGQRESFIVCNIVI